MTEKTKKTKKIVEKTKRAHHHVKRLHHEVHGGFSDGGGPVAIPS
jgi:thiamine kinase-like enzyme